MTNGLNKKGLKDVTLKGQSNGTLPTIKCENNKPLAIHNTGTIVIEDLRITDTSFKEILNTSITNVFMQQLKVFSYTSMTNCTVNKSEFHVLQPSLDPAMELFNTKVFMQDVVISNSYGDGLYMGFIGSQSRLNN